MIQELLDFVVAAFVLVFVFTQLMWPIIKGTRLFPSFRKDIVKAESELVRAKQDSEVTSIAQQAADIKTQTTKSRKGKKK